jgi:hypothetical protein
VDILAERLMGSIIRNIPLNDTRNCRFVDVLFLAIGGVEPIQQSLYSFARIARGAAHCDVLFRRQTIIIYMFESRFIAWGALPERVLL